MTTTWNLACHHGKGTRVTLETFKLTIASSSSEAILLTAHLLDRARHVGSQGKMWRLVAVTAAAFAFDTHIFYAFVVFIICLLD